jgi:hypothetical protein
MNRAQGRNVGGQTQIVFTTPDGHGRNSISCRSVFLLINTRLQSGGSGRRGSKRFQPFSSAKRCGIGQAVETALACAILATGLKPGVKEALIKSRFIFLWKFHIASMAQERF